MASPRTITPCLWFDGNAEEAAEFYLSVFPGGTIHETFRAGEGGPMPAGSVLTMTIEIAGQRLILLNGGPQFPLTEAVSLFVPCETQAEVDELWATLTAGGGRESHCGWLVDRFGLSWQIVPTVLFDLLKNDPSGRVMQAMLGMHKLDIAALERAGARG